MLDVPALRRRRIKKSMSSRVLSGIFYSDADLTDPSSGAVQRKITVQRETHGQKRRADALYESDTETLKKLGMLLPNHNTPAGKADRALRDVY